jgi:hypothetical protein
MIDKLFLRSKIKLRLDKVQSYFPGLIFSFVPDTIYKTTLIIKKEKEHLITIKTNPIWSHVYNTEIQLNPKNWESLGHLNKTLSKFIDINSLSIKRIDHLVDIDIPMDDLFKCLRIKFKQKWTFLHEETGKFSKSTGFYYGKEPELLCIYDKGFETENKRGLKRNKEEPLGVSTRIELRHSNAKVPFKRFTDLERYLTFEPFKNIVFLKLLNKDSLLGPKHDALKLLLARDGLTRVYYQLNEQQNFKRNYSKYFEEVDFKTILLEKYWDNLGHFINNTK